MEVKCQYCNKNSVLVKGDVIYPHRKDLYNLFFWYCEDCNAYVGTHKNSKEHRPLGVLANNKLRKLKRNTHKVFDRLWKEGNFSRHGAYKWLARKLYIDASECHIALFNEDLCELTILYASRKNNSRRM